MDDREIAESRTADRWRGNSPRWLPPRGPVACPRAAAPAASLERPFPSVALRLSRVLCPVSHLESFPLLPARLNSHALSRRRTKSAISVQPLPWIPVDGDRSDALEPNPRIIRLYQCEQPTSI